MSKRMQLKDLEVQSFVTTQKTDRMLTIHGGAYTDTVCTEPAGCSDPAHCATGSCPWTKPRAICLG